MDIWKSFIFLNIFLLIEPIISASPNQIKTIKNNEIYNPPESVLYYGWFLDEVTASSLERLTTEYLQNVILNISDVKEFIETASEKNNVTDLMTYFTKPLDPNTSQFDPYFHVTSKFCGDSDCSPYYELAKPYIGKKFQTTLIGVYFTERTYGVRVALTDEQDLLFEMEDDNYNKSAHLTLHSVPKATAAAEYDGIEFEPQEEDFHPLQSRAHVTLGCAPGIPAVVTGLDLLDILIYEDEVLLNQTSFQDYWVKDIGTLRQFGDEMNNASRKAFVFYLNQKMIVETTFQAYYISNSSGSYHLYMNWFTLLMTFIPCFAFNYYR